MRLLGFAVVLCIAIAPLVAEAQEAGKVVRIGYLAAALEAFPQRVDAFRQGLRDLRYVENRNITIESRSAHGHLERLPDLAAELVRLKVDILVTDATPPTLAAKNATQTSPARWQSHGAVVPRSGVGRQVSGTTQGSPSETC